MLLALRIAPAIPADVADPKASRRGLYVRPELCQPLISLWNGIVGRWAAHEPAPVASLPDFQRRASLLLSELLQRGAALLSKTAQAATVASGSLGRLGGKEGQEECHLPALGFRSLCQRLAYLSARSQRVNALFVDLGERPLHHLGDALRLALGVLAHSCGDTRRLSLFCHRSIVAPWRSCRQTCHTKIRFLLLTLSAMLPYNCTTFCRTNQLTRGRAESCTMPKRITEPMRSRLFLAATGAAITMLSAVAYLAHHPADVVAIGEAMREPGALVGYVFGGVR